MGCPWISGAELIEHVVRTNLSCLFSDIEIGRRGGALCKAWRFDKLTIARGNSQHRVFMFKQLLKYTFWSILNVVNLAVPLIRLFCDQACDFCSIRNDFLSSVFVM